MDLAKRQIGDFCVFLSGGSSGGEAALISSFGSPLGFGSDLGGSIRQPAGMCGIYGFRPTSARMRYLPFENTSDEENKYEIPFVHNDVSGFLRPGRNARLFVWPNHLKKNSRI